MRIRDWAVPITILLGLLWAGTSSASSAKSGSGGKGSRFVPKGGKVSMKQTGGADAKSWAQDRYTRSVHVLTGQGIPLSIAHEMALSALAHWAVETANGTHEYNYNVGGITARSDDQFYEAMDVGAGVKQKFAAYDSADEGVADYWALLASSLYADCLAQLHDKPTGDGWIRCLGAKGYYGDKTAKSQETMAKAVAGQRGALAAIIHD